MFASESTYLIYQQHMKETDPILIRVQCDSAEEYTILQQYYSKTICVTVFSIVIVVILVVALVLFV